jgi:hypothetical protein
VAEDPFRTLSPPDPPDTTMTNASLAARLVAPVLVAFAAILATPAPAAAQVRGASGEMTVPQFMANLANYGRWFAYADRGWAWQPSRVSPQWRPYSHGEWFSITGGLAYWHSYEPFGWAVYHYGQWLLDPRVGWVWIPGTEWRPAWVTWRSGNGFVGWAPTPPTGVDPCTVEPFAWNFVSTRYLRSSSIERQVMPFARNVNLVGATSCVGAPDPADFARLLGSSRRVDLVRSPRASDRGAAGLVTVYAPALTGSAPPLRGRTPELPAATLPVEDVPGAPPAGTDPEHPLDRHELERSRLAAEQSEDREELQSLHESDATNPPLATMTPEQVREWQRKENAEHAAIVARERRMLDEKHREELAPPAADPPPAKPAGD